MFTALANIICASSSPLGLPTLGEEARGDGDAERDGEAERGGDVERTRDAAERAGDAAERALQPCPYELQHWLPHQELVSWSLTACSAAVTRSIENCALAPGELADKTPVGRELREWALLMGSSL